MEPLFRATFVAYCGMSMPLCHALTKVEMTDWLKRFLKRKRRAGLVVEKIGKNNWEIQAKEGTRCMVGDDEGTLHVMPDNRFRY